MSRIGARIGNEQGGNGGKCCTNEKLPAGKVEIAQKTARSIRNILATNVVNQEKKQIRNKEWLEEWKKHTKKEQKGSAGE